MTALAPPTRFGPALASVYRAHLSRARVTRVSLLLVASMQSIGIMLLLRGVVSSGDRVTKEQVVAGATVLVVAFVAVNLLAQRIGALRDSGGLGFYGALPVSGAAVVLGIAASYASFAVPGVIVTAVVGVLLYGLPVGHLWLLLPVVVLAGASLAGVGAVIGLAVKAELVTVCGQLAMSVALFLGIIPADRLPVILRGVVAVVPSTYAVRALAEGLHRRPDLASAWLDLAVCAVVAVVSLTAASAVFRRAVVRG